MTPDADRLHVSWEALRSSLADLETFLLDSSAVGESDRPGAYRLILGIQKWVVDRYFLGHDPERPRFIKFYDEFSQWGLGNPDNAYWIAEIRPGNEYLVTGHAGNVTDLCIEVRDGLMRKETGEHSKTLAYVDLAGLKVDDDGRYRIRIGGEPDGGNHLPLPDSSENVLVRQTFGDWDVEEVAPFWIERLGPAAAPAPEDTAESVSRQVGDVARRLSFVTRANHDQVSEFRKVLLTNAFPAPTVGLAVKSKTGFFPGQHNALGWWEIAREEALVVTLPLPPCRYLGFMIGHPIWFRQLDFDNRQNSLNSAQARISSDGMVHIVIAGTDPGVPNWIDCGSLTSGFMFFRCQGLTGEFAQPQTTLVPLSSVRDALPPNEPLVTTQERYEVLKRRRIAVARRFM